MRVKTSGILGASAWCDDCEFEQFKRNAMGLAAIHADSHPGHTTHVEQVLGVTYNPKKRETE